MNTTTELTKEGDLVLLYVKEDSILPVYLKKDAIFNCRFGQFHHNNLINIPFGSIVYSTVVSEKQKMGWLHLLRPNAELWTLSLPHRTQIVYSMDASYICLSLYLKNGSKLIESGTGTGSLTHHFAQCVGSEGHVYTYEFNENRVMQAKQEFINNKIDSIVTIEHRDVYEDGFNEELIDTIDAVFLDLPKPWIVIENAKKFLKSGGRICTFSPCIEQVQNNCQKMAELGFADVETVEVLMRPFEVMQKLDNSSPTYGEYSKTVNGEEECPSYWQQRESVCKPVKEVRGHTSYLSFGTLY